ncbi:MAG TPA: undecaprenyl-diphosphate phosphatase [Bacteroidia bacterium]|jgi:undecaprenyl-diphosphatase|nr:undecaprenyl-diphosphate phosphatase [Bacteroidia bacterium]HQF29396.1 undecaprenyl-diphosphate phosphatase [Bacteroidia bacterium]HQK97682.1 undecaprenyl-diphosphate phosphatase [Bacteroidia bacterium]
MKLFEAIILAIVEGLTEFLPVSSTGHMIIASSLMGIAEDPFTKAFTVAIQFGAILSVVVLYFKRFFQSMNFYYKLLAAFIPAAILGKLLDDYIDALLSNVLVVGFTLLAGGVVLVFIDVLVKNSDRDDSVDDITYPDAVKIGLFQCIAMIPGVSRSAATIIGGMAQNFSRKTAAEFSFFLAVPTMFAATVYKLYKFYKTMEVAGTGFTKDQLLLLGVGNIVAFLVALLAIKSFITFLTKYGFRVFGYYRIVVGIAIIILFIAGVDLKIL